MSDSDEIYRKAALDHYLTAREFGEITRVSPPWTWALLVIVAAALITACLLAIFTKIEVTDRAPGVLVAEEADFRVISFLPERHGSLVKNNDPVQLELAQFPHPELGTARGRIVRIGSNLASTREIGAALGDGARLAGPAYRIEILVLPDSSSKAPIPLKEGMRADVRYTVRRERPVFLLFPRLRRWVNG